MSPGRARLLTGTSCVGTLVILASGMLCWDVSRSIFPTTAASATTEYLSVLAFFTGAAGVLLPFDLMGGLVIPAAFESRPPRLRFWVRQWFRSVGIQSLFFSLTFFIYLQIGRAIGAPWLVAMFAVLQTTLVAGQELLWQALTANWTGAAHSGRTHVVAHSDERFMGGIAGLPGFETILVPRAWGLRLRPASLVTLVNRRRVALTCGGRSRGILCAMCWNISGFTLCIIAAGTSVQSVADIVSVYLWFLLFSFAGLLILPVMNRQSVFALDQRFSNAHSHLELREAIADVDRITDQDPTRSASAESVFQPIPCSERRSRSLETAGSGHVIAWNIARTALFLSWAYGGPLARAVHCNVGRTELWAMMPTD